MLMIEAWRKTWREGIAPQLPTAGLEALARALADDDPALLQGATTTPPPLEALRAWPVEGACPIGLALWQGDGRQTVGAVEEAFALVCEAANAALGEEVAVRYFLNWWDDSDRAACRVELLGEVRRVLAERAPVQVSAA